MQPGQFFTEYLDALPKATKNYSLADKKKAVSVANIARSSGMFFAVEGYSKPQVDIDKTFSNIPFTPPYPVTILEYTLSIPYFGGTVMSPRILIAKQEPEGVVIIPIVYHEGLSVSWTPPYVMFLLPEQRANFCISPLLPDAFKQAEEFMRRDGRDVADVLTNTMIADLATYADFCRTLHENETTFADIEPNASKNKMRRTMGKAPLFTYKVLTIGKPKQKSKHQGGTHASPRSHMRRGCYRTSKNGVRHWVQPCMIKGETDGFVHKDYNVVAA
jgi:hypothetical protein